MRKYIIALMMALALVVSMSSMCSADSNYWLEEPAMLVFIPDGYDVLTRELSADDPVIQKYDKLFGISTLNYLSSSAVYLDAFNLQDRMEILVSMEEGYEDFDFQTYRESFQDYFVPALKNLLESSMELKVMDWEIVDHPQTAFIVFYNDFGDNAHYSIQYYTIHNHRSINIVMHSYTGPFSDSAKNQMRHLIDTMLFGYVTEIADPSSGSIQQTNNTPAMTSTQQITVEDIGLTAVIPASMEWATRNTGNSTYIADNYNMSVDSLTNYMASQDYYLMAVDTESSLRMSCIRSMAKADVKNYTSLSDEEIKAGINQAESLADNTWIWRNESFAFLCSEISYPALQQYQITAQTAIDGWFYIFIFRDSDDEKLRDNCEAILAGLDIQVAKDGSNLVIESCRLSLPLPEKWSISEQLTQDNGTLSVESVTLNLIHSDGTRGLLGITIMDVFAVIEGPEPIVTRGVFDVLYAKQLVDEMFTSNNLTRISHYQYNSKDFWTTRNDTELTGASMVGIANGYMLKLDWYVASGDALDDAAFSEIQEFMPQLIAALPDGNSR